LESKWRQNVVEVGAQETNVLLCARLLVNPDIFVLKLSDFFVDGFCVWGSFLDTGLFNVEAVVPKLQPHFPYGYGVESDQM